MRKFCNSCGNALDENDKFCTTCGQKVEINEESKNPQKEEIIVDTLENDEIVTSDKENIEQDDKLDKGLQVLSFCLPIVGIVLYFSNKNSKPKTAETACHSSLWGWAFALLIGIIISIAVASKIYDEHVYGESSLDHTESLSSVDSAAILIDSADAVRMDEDPIYQLELMDSKSKSYTCRQCGEHIPWIGSYYWSSYLDGNGSVKNDITKLEDLEYSGDERIDTQMYTDAGLISRGIFCSMKCTKKNLSNWTYPEEYRQYIGQ